MEQSIDLNALRIFQKVVELRSFTGASKSLNIPKSKVSRTISYLEELFQTQLIFRTTRQIELTSSGTRLYSQCYNGLDLLAQGLKSAFDQTNQIDGTIRITTVEDIGVHLLTPIISRFNEQYPNIHIDLKYGFESYELVNSAIDFAIRVGSVKQLSLKQRRVGEVQFVLVASPKYLERFQNSLSVDDLEKADVIPFSGFNIKKHGLKLIRNSEVKKLKLTPRIEATSTAAILELTLFGRGIGLLPNFLCLPSLKKETLQRVCPGWHTQSKPVQIVTTASKNKSPAHQVFSKFLYEGLTQQLAKTL